MPSSGGARPARRARLVALLAATAALASACAVTVKVPTLNEVLADAERLAQSTKIYAADGSVLAVLHAGENREVVALTQVPEHVRNAVLAIEDARFYQHGGVDPRAVARALWSNATEGTIVEGGSTITQQLARSLLLRREKTVARKVREATVAFQLERRFSKDEILERYLNTVYFGQGAYGIEAAARTYFGAHARDLTLAQGALLAGLIRAPGRYDPSDPAPAVARRNVVLGRMRDEGFITDGERAIAADEPAGVRIRSTERRFRAPYFVDYVKQLVQHDDRFAALGDDTADRIDALFRGGLRIYTTLDPSLQDAAEAATARVLDRPDDPESAFVAVRPADGAVLAMVGGRDWYDDDDPVAKFNLATKARRQPGSAFKPFTLVAALEKGITLDRMYTGGARIAIKQPGREPWVVSNYGDQSFGSRLTLRQATAKSVNVVYAQVVNQVGASSVVEVARRMGITSSLLPYPSIALGAQEVTPLELAGAYAPFANGGLAAPPTAITRITNAEGAEVYAAPAPSKRVLEPAVTGLALEALQEVMRSGTGSRLQVGRPAAGKTGTTDDFRDAWFVGFVPQIAAASWVGFAETQKPMVPPNTRIRVVGGSWPGEIWREFMVRALRDLPVEPFPVSSADLVRVRIDTARGCLPNPFTPPALIAERSFVKGTEPTAVCTEPASATIDTTPDTVGRPAAEAVRALEHAGYIVAERPAYCPAFREGTVCRQEPAPGATGRVGDRAIVYVSDDAQRPHPVTVPMVLEERESAAVETLRRLGLHADVRRGDNRPGLPGCRAPDEREPGVVWLQSPCAGERSTEGSTVTIWVSG